MSCNIPYTHTRQNNIKKLPTFVFFTPSGSCFLLHAVDLQANFSVTVEHRSTFHSPSRTLLLRGLMNTFTSGFMTKPLHSPYSLHQWLYTDDSDHWHQWKTTKAQSSLSVYSALLQIFTGGKVKLSKGACIEKWFISRSQYYLVPSGGQIYEEQLDSTTWN